MLDQNQLLLNTDTPGAQVYRDDKRPERFYAYPRQPRVARDPAGGPAISALFYGKKVDGILHCTGGMLSLTTSLGFSEAEVQQLRVRLATLRHLEMNLADNIALPAVEIVYPEWLGGTVSVRLGGELTLEGTPSLLGANEAAMSMLLDADQVKQLQEQWKRGLPDATIRYTMQSQGVRRKTASESSAYSSSSATAGATTHHSVLEQVDLHLTAAVPLTIEVEGALGLTTADLQGKADEIVL